MIIGNFEFGIVTKMYVNFKHMISPSFYKEMGQL